MASNEEIRRKLQENVYFWRSCLEKSFWEPDREHIEMVISQMQRAADSIASQAVT